MSAVWMRVRADLKHRWRSGVGIIIIIAVAGMVVLAGVAGARKTDAAYPDFLRAQRASHGGIANSGGFFGFADVDFAAVQRFPEVAESAPFSFFTVIVRTDDGKVLTPIADQNPVVAFASADGKFDLAFNKMRAWRGRLPDQGSIDQVSVSYDAWKAYGLDPGETLHIQVATPNDLRAASEGTPLDELGGPRLDVRVTSVHLAPGELPPGIGYPPIHFTQAFFNRYSRVGFQFPALMVRLKHDGLWPAFVERVQREAIPRGGRYSRPQLLVNVENKRSIMNSAHVQAVALWLLVALVGATALMIFVQTLARDAFLGADESVSLGSLGMTTGQLFGAGVIRLSILASVGAALACVGAVLLSPLTPIGVVRLVVPRGLHVDVAVLVLGSLALVVVVLSIGLAPTLRSSSVRRVTKRAALRSRPSIVAGRLAAAGVPPATVAGVQMALEPGRGRTAVPVRSTLFGTVVGVIAIVIALTFAASISHLLATPRLQGINWSAVVGDDFDPDDFERVIPVLRAQPDITEISYGGTETVSVRGRATLVVAMDRASGSIGPVVIEGTAPTHDDEIALDPRVIKKVGSRVGDVVPVDVGHVRRDLRITASIVAPSIGPGSTALGFMTLEALRSLQPRAARDVYLYRVAQGKDAAVVAARVKEALPDIQVGVGVPSGDVRNLASVRALPFVLAGILAVLAIATLAHLLVSAIRRRARDLAILKTLGFVRGQVRATVAWQATSVVVFALVVGVPAGIGAGRWAWSMLADQLGFPSAPALDGLALGSLLAAALLVANVIAFGPGRAAARARPSTSLRIE